MAPAHRQGVASSENKQQKAPTSPLAGRHLGAASTTSTSRRDAARDLCGPTTVDELVVVRRAGGRAGVNCETVTHDGSPPLVHSPHQLQKPPAHLRRHQQLTGGRRAGAQRSPACLALVAGKGATLRETLLSPTTAARPLQFDNAQCFGGPLNRASVVSFFSPGYFS